MSASDDLGDALATTQHSVFRLEALQSYPDDELWARYQRGDAFWAQDQDMIDWCALVSAATDPPPGGRGVTWIRARIVTEPWTAYTCWEIEEHYPHNLRAGEQARLVRGEMPGVVDFWLVDDRRAWLLTYDTDGAMTVVEATDRTLPTLRAWRDIALARAVPMAVPTSL